MDTVRELGLSSVAAAVFALLVGLVWLKLIQAQRRRQLFRQDLGHGLLWATFLLSPDCLTDLCKSWLSSIGSHVPTLRVCAVYSGFHCCSGQGDFPKPRCRVLVTAELAKLCGEIRQEIHGHCSVWTLLASGSLEATLRDKKEKAEFDLMVEQSFSTAGAFIISDYVPYLSFITKLQGWQKIFEENRDFKERVTKKIVDIEGHRERAKERGNNDKDYVPDFVDVLLAAPFDDGKLLSDKLVSILVSELLNAGTDTSATTIEWAMSELILNPHLIKQAQEELDAVVGVDGRLVQESDIPKLPYLQAIVKETFRMHPAAPLAVLRESTQPSQVLGYSFPAQTRLILNLFAIHRDPDVYENPDTFDPDRFVAHPEVDHTAIYDYYQLMPFGVGRRMCPGYHVGDVMVHLMVANLLHNFDWSLPKGETVESFDMSEVMSLVVSRKNPLCLVANPRLPNAHLA